MTPGVVFGSVSFILGLFCASAVGTTARGETTPGVIFQAPATEVFLLALNPGGTPMPWVNISQSPGYDNQPSFLPDSTAVLFASNRDGKQTDIYRYDIATKQLTQLTKTAEPEYSPLVTPDGKGFSVIRVETDGTQRLWRFNLDGSDPKLVLEKIKPVGYHTWIDATHLALFVLGSPATLQIADTTTGTAEVVDSGIGRSILMRPKAGTVTYMTTGPSRTIKEFDPKARTSASLMAPLEGSQDMAWMPDGRQIWMASGTAVSAATAGGDKPATWAQRLNLVTNTFDSSRQPVASITRMAISPDGRWLAFVAELGTP